MSNGDIEDEVGSDFDANAHPAEKGEYALIPVGWQLLLIDKPEVWKSDDKKKSALNMECTVMEGEFKGRKIWPKIVLKSESEKEKHIGDERLGSLAIAFGLTALKDSAILKDKLVWGNVYIWPAKGKYKAKNDVKAWKAYEGSASTPAPAPEKAKTSPAPKAASAPKAAPKSNANLPWLSSNKKKAADSDDVPF